MTTIQTILDTGVSRQWLRCELYRRAAFHFEKCGNMLEAAECWAGAGENARAAEIYLESKDQAKAAPLLLKEGRYAEALACYRNRLEGLPENAVENRVTAMLGISSCLKLMKQDRRIAREMYHRARRIIEDEDGRKSMLSAKCWEALGAYGVALNRDDLIHVGYEKALKRHEESHLKDRLNASRQYLESILENRLLAADIESRIAELTSALDAETALPPVQLRSDQMTVSEDDFIEVFKLNEDWRPLEYIENDFEDLEDIILDRTTGLIWQKWHSKQELIYEDARKYVENLNQERFAGFSDWRLPTIPELSSLLENEKQSNGLFINPIFKTDRPTEIWYWCWSSDQRAGGGAWSVNFNLGDVYWNYMDYSYYVRVCRS